MHSFCLKSYVFMEGNICINPHSGDMHKNVINCLNLTFQADSQDKYLFYMHSCVFGIHMKQARVKISDRTNQVLNIVKAKYNLKDKSAAIELVVARYESEMLEPELKPEYIEKMGRIHQEKPVFVGKVDELDKFIDGLPDEDDD